MAEINARLMKGEETDLTPNEKLILYYRRNPVEACRDLLGIELIWFQRIALRAIWEKPYILLNMGRGSGKSFLGCIFSVLKCMLYPKTRIGVFGPSLRQAFFVFDEIERIWSDSVYLRACSPDGVKKSPNGAIIKFPSNGSFIEGLPIGNDGGTVRGRRYSIVFVDEMAKMDDEIVKLVIRPMLNIKVSGRQNQFIQASTAFHKYNHFWVNYCHYHRKRIEQPDKYDVLEFDYRDIMMVPDSPFQVDEEIIEMQFSDMTSEQFSMECLSLFPDEGMGFFPARLVDACCPKKEENRINIELTGESDAIYTMGVDCARSPGGDNFSLAITKVINKNIQLVYLETLNGETFQKMTETIRTRCIDFPIAKICNDFGGGGQTLADLLAQPWKDPRTPHKEVYLPILEIEPQNDLDAERQGSRILEQVRFTNESKNQMFNDLKAEMQHRRFFMPIDLRRHEDHELEHIGKEIVMAKTEMMAVQTSSSTQGLRFTVPNPYKMDRITSVVLATKAALSLIKKDDMPIQTDQLPIGIWVNEFRAEHNY